ncbi:hypothetical protein AB8Q98_27915, partial [Klebsiella pneumoniae]|nr:hypothetical protein C2U44_32255 [Klebsiella oxytoca]MBX4732251.1 hypothetical protein [Klebsiella pneumoniae]POT80699.1 hypothetical protein C3417_32865 [Klebsiella oxytoca]
MFTLKVRQPEWFIVMCSGIRKSYTGAKEGLLGFVNGMVASHLLCHSGTINRHSLNGALLS